MYTVFLQEAGHALGIGNSPNTSSAMYEFYQGTRTGLSAEDVGRIQDLYGARPTRTWEPAGGNNTASAATPWPGPTYRVTFGDVASAADADWYWFTAPRPGRPRSRLQSVRAQPADRPAWPYSTRPWRGSASRPRPGRART